MYLQKVYKNFSIYFYEIRESVRVFQQRITNTGLFFIIITVQRALDSALLFLTQNLSQMFTIIIL